MLKTLAEVYEIIGPADPDSIRALGNNEFALNWLKGGFTPEQLAGLQGNEKVAALVGPYQPKGETAITHQIRIKIL
jgi:hypothetical protein